MTEFIEFLKLYWRELLVGVCFVLEIIFIFIKRKPKSVDEFKAACDEVVGLIPTLVNSVERPGHGEEKKILVISRAISLFERLIGRKLSDAEKLAAEKRFSDTIELVLTTPVKKGSTDEK